MYTDLLQVSEPLMPVSISDDDSEVAVVLAHIITNYLSVYFLMMKIFYLTKSMKLQIMR